jgi:hypothetical protein
MCLTINHSKAFGVKDDLIHYIEENEGIDVTSNSLDSEFSDIIKKAGYFTTGKCEDKDDNGYDFIGYTRDGARIAAGSAARDAAVCIKQVKINPQDYLNSNLGDTYVPEEEEKGCYYEVEVFYRLDIPVIGTATNYNVKGQTKVLYGNYCE